MSELLPLDNAGIVAVVLLALQVGAAAPAYYAQERFRGFARAMLDKLPYLPPPGLSEEQALAAAVESAEEEQDDGEDNE